jgi:hypothetical protein
MVAMPEMKKNARKGFTLAFPMARKDAIAAARGVGAVGKTNWAREEQRRR